MLFQWSNELIKESMADLSESEKQAVECMLSMLEPTQSPGGRMQR
jgi:hypothetical protein